MAEELKFYNVVATKWHQQIAIDKSCRVELYICVRTKEYGTAYGFYMVRVFADKGIIDRNFGNVKNAIKYYNAEVKKINKRAK